LSSKYIEASDEDRQPLCVVVSRKLEKYRQDFLS